MACAAPLAASGDDFWNRKPPSRWAPGEIYRLLNRSPWACAVEWYIPGQPEMLTRSKAVVTWESAQPVRAARKSELNWIFDASYAVGVDGVPATGRSATDLLPSVALRSTGKEKWTIRAALAKEIIGTSSVFVFGFPRAGGRIGPESGDVVFEMRLDGWMIDARFKPKEMRYRGKPAV